MSEHKFGSTSDFFLKRMAVVGGRGYLRENMFGHEIIWDGIRYTFDDKKLILKKDIKRRDSGKRHLFIFALVKKDAERYIKNNIPRHAKWVASTEYNKRVRKNVPVIGTDIDGAYWRIAWQRGVICENTYRHGMRINDKEICVAALANLGSDKTYQVVKDGKLTGKYVVIKGDPALRAAYTMIRYMCFEFMKQLAKMLGRDFYSYKTDAIYYVKTKKNVAMVTGFLEDHELDYKMITSTATKMKKK
jgi:hypothetical protein